MVSDNLKSEWLSSSLESGKQGDFIVKINLGR